MMENYLDKDMAASMATPMFYFPYCMIPLFLLAHKIGMQEMVRYFPPALLEVEHEAPEAGEVGELGVEAEVCGGIPQPQAEDVDKMHSEGAAKFTSSLGPEEDLLCVVGDLLPGVGESGNHQKVSHNNKLEKYPRLKTLPGHFSRKGPCIFIMPPTARTAKPRCRLRYCSSI